MTSEIIRDYFVNSDGGDIKDFGTYSEALTEYNKCFKTDIKQLKNLQEQALSTLISGKDCVCSLPTGYGKSLIYELLPFIDSGCLVIVIAPLNAIIKQQVQKLGDMAMGLARANDIGRLKSAKLSFVFSHPEDILDSRELNDAFTSDSICTRNIYLVVDEAHCVLEWGDDFRPDYNKLSQLRAVLNCNVLALSATVTENGQKQIISSLLMKKFNVVSASPAKDNIKLIVKTRPSPNSKGNTASSPYDKIFQNAILGLNSQLDNYPITIIYCKSMQWIGYGYEMARRLLGDNFYTSKTPQIPRVVMFHSSMEKGSGKLKDMILSSLQQPEEDCSIRLIISSVALGMGADLKHVKRVIHAGPPTTLETYVQEIGRSGRAGTAAEAILHFNNHDLADHHMRKEMKDYCKGERCHRELINEYFGFNTEEKPAVCCNKCQPELGLQWDFDNLSIV